MCDVKHTSPKLYMVSRVIKLNGLVFYLMASTSSFSQVVKLIPLNSFYWSWLIQITFRGCCKSKLSLLALT